MREPLDDVRAAILSELELVGDRPTRQFEMGAAAAYNHVLSLLPADSGLREHEPDDHHEYRITCMICRQPGTVLLSIEPKRAALADDLGSELGRLLAERNRLIASGVDPDELELPLRPTE